MTEEQKNRLGKVLWDVADRLRGAMDADDFRDYMLSFLFLCHLSKNYEEAAKKERGDDSPLQEWYANNSKEDKKMFEGVMRRRLHYVIKPEFLWDAIAAMAKEKSIDLLARLRDAFKYIEEESFKGTFHGLFSEINLDSDKLGKSQADRNNKLCEVVSTIASGLAKFSTDRDDLGNAYEYLIEQFAAGSGKKAGEFYTPQPISTILSKIVILDNQDPSNGKERQSLSVLDFSCGSGSLLLNVRRHRSVQQSGAVSKIYGQESNVTAFNLARMNMLLHGVKDTEFDLFHGDTLKNEWDILREEDPAKKLTFDAVIANPPFSLRWQSKEEYGNDPRFKDYGIAPRSAADFAFLLHGFHYLKDDGTMAIIMPHGILFRGGAEYTIRKKLLDDNNIDAVIGLPANLFYSTGIPVCILVLKKCRKADDVLFINASQHFQKGKRQNNLREQDIEKIVTAYKERKKEERYSEPVSLTKITKEKGYSLSISEYINMTESEKERNLQEINTKLQETEKKNRNRS